MTIAVMTRKAAKAAGLKSYLGGAPCVHGHTDGRRVSNGECLTCRALRLAAWRTENPEGVRKHNKEQYARHAEVLKLRARQFYVANKEACDARGREYQKQNMHVYIASGAKRRAAKLQRTPAWLAADDFWMMEQAYELAQVRTKLFGFTWHVDHVVPLQGKLVSGLHVPTNLQVISKTSNRKKANTYEVA